MDFSGFCIFWFFTFVIIYSRKKKANFKNNTLELVISKSAFFDF